MLYRSERERDGTIRLHPHSRDTEDPGNVHQNGSQEYLSEIDNFIKSLQASLWPLNKFIHENPELAFKEYKAHEALTEFVRSQKDWQVTTSAYGIETAWVAAYDSGKAGPVVSFNAEFGKPISHVVQK